MTTVRLGVRARAQRQSPRWASRAAMDLHLQPATVEARVHGMTRVTVQAEAAGIIRRAREFGAHHIAEKVFGPIEAAFAGMDIPELSATLIRDVQVADLDEDRREIEYLTDPTLEHRRAWANALRAQRATSLRLLLALEAE